MAKLGSSVDARLSRISPYAIRAIEQGGASMGAAYANVGSSLGKAITSITTRMRDDKINTSLNEALAASMSINPGDGTKTFDRKTFMEFAKGTVPPKAAREFADKRFDLVQKENNIIEQQIARALHQSNVEDEFDLKEQELAQKGEKAEFDKAQLKIGIIQKGIENDLRKKEIDIQGKLFDQGEEDRERRKAEAEAKKLSDEEKKAKFARNAGLIQRINDEVRNPNTSQERLKELQDKLKELNITNEVLNESLGRQMGTLQFALEQMIDHTVDAGADASEPWEVKLENAGNQMRKTLESHLLPEQLEQYNRYLLDGQETESSRGFLGNLKNQLEAQGGKLRPGSGEQILRDSIDLYLTTFENPDVSLGNITPSYESPEEKQKRLEQRSIDRMMMMASGP
tara:strand:- start:353 stop:1549 length:1197 start_codon:yes stop_codon:yes gene_type:complete